MITEIKDLSEIRKNKKVKPIFISIIVIVMHSRFIRTRFDFYVRVRANTFDYNSLYYVTDVIVLVTFRCISFVQSISFVQFKSLKMRVQSTQAFFKLCGA